MNQKTPEFTVQIVTHNSAKDLPALLDSLKSFAEVSPRIRVIDNNSEDNSIALIETQLPSADIIRLSRNTGYATAHNIGFAKCTTPFVLVVNPDAALHEKGIKEMIDACAVDDSIGAMQGLVLRDGDVIVDSAGISQTLTLNGVDIGAGNAHTNQYRKQVPVDGVTGACGLFRMKALQDVSHGTYKEGDHKALEVFDKDFFAYKEDVDLGWRLRNKDWKMMFFPAHTATHVRAVKPQGVLGFWDRVGDARTRFSLRNYVWMILKNASTQQLITRGVFIILRLAVFLIISILYPPLFTVWIEILRGARGMIHKGVHETINHHS